MRTTREPGARWLSVEILARVYTEKEIEQILADYESGKIKSRTPAFTPDESVIEIVRSWIENKVTEREARREIGRITGRTKVAGVMMRTLHYMTNNNLLSQ